MRTLKTNEEGKEKRSCCRSCNETDHWFTGDYEDIVIWKKKTLEIYFKLSAFIINKI
jgi:hypothetical protein